MKQTKLSGISENAKMNAYEYVERIGAGSYGEVSLIKSKKTSKKCVAKKVVIFSVTFYEFSRFWTKDFS